MILVRLMGGLGNQMFQYATAHSVSLRNNTVVKIDTSLLEANLLEDDKVVTHRNLDLDIFDLKITKATPQEIIYFNGKKYDNLLGKLYNRLIFFSRKKNLIIEKDRSFQSLVLSLPDNICLVGGWQSPKYFEGYEQEIKNLFAFKKPLLDVSKTIFEEIRNANSICIHVRRGDYVTSPKYNKSLGAKSAEYYNHAITIFESKIENPKFFIFSDDLNWCKQHLKSKSPFTFVEEIHAGEKNGNYLQLMTHCKNFIISNSTYSWWGAWLSKNESKLVVAPKTWALDPASVPADILPENWIKIDL